MGEFKSALKPYDVEAALAGDRGEDCLVIDVGRDEAGRAIPSLKHVSEQVERYLQHARSSTFAATKLYLIGKWNLTPPEYVVEDEWNKNEIEKERANSVKKWSEAIQMICTLLEQMGGLKELTWISGLPFTAAVWDKLPTSLTRLVLDLGEPVRLDQDGSVLHRSYITLSEMKPLQEQVKLKELRLFRVHESLQPLVWETVFRNTSDGGMRVLELQMAAAPIVRSEQWKKATDVAGLTVPTEELKGQVYKGKDGKGVLHYTIGTGEYLDDFCIRKARIASGLDEAIPLPLSCLKVDGFVIDSLPFEHELSGIVLLTCGEKCIDSGLRAPKTGRAPHNKWSKAVNNAASHCLIQWPNWAGIFDGQGDQRDKLGIVVPQELVLSTPVDPFASSPILALIEESLEMKALSDALDDTTNDTTNLGNLTFSSLLSSPGVQTSLEVMSNKPGCGSDVPTTIALSSATACPLLASLEAALSTSPTDSGMVVVDGTTDPMSPMSMVSSFEHVSPPTSFVDSDSTYTGSEVTTSDESDDNITPKKSTLAHKVRLSFDWFTGSASR